MNEHENGQADGLIYATQAAAILGVHRQTLERWRREGVLPPGCYIKSRKVRKAYIAAAIRDFARGQAEKGIVSYGRHSPLNGSTA